MGKKKSGAKSPGSSSSSSPQPVVPSAATKPMPVSSSSHHATASVVSKVGAPATTLRSGDAPAASAKGRAALGWLVASILVGLLAAWIARNPETLLSSQTLEKLGATPLVSALVSVFAPPAAGEAAAAVAGRRARSKPKSAAGKPRARTSDYEPTWTPATEMARGLPGTAQRALYESPGYPAGTSFVVCNDASSTPLDIYWNGRLLAHAAARERANVETWVGHVFTIDGVEYTADGTFAALVKVPGEPRLRPAAELPPVTPNPSRPPPPRNVRLESDAKAVKIRNLSNKRFNEYWIPRSGEPVYQGVIEPNSETTTNSYLTHRFQFRDLRRRDKVVFDFTVNAKDEIYAYVDNATADPHKLKMHREELAFAADYKKRTGRPWMSHYPHRPVQTFLWPADYVGQVHTVAVSKTSWDKAPGNMTLEVVSTRPRVFLIKNFVSPAEAAHLVALAQTSLQASGVHARDEHGNLVQSATRTSENSWIARDKSDAVVDDVFRRVAEVTRVDDAKLHHDRPDGMVESLQVVHYYDSKAYAPHHDWGVHGGPWTRLMTLLMYLNDKAEPDAGGETGFPKARIGRAKGYVNHPGAGHAVLFYSQHPDGNCDDDSLHEAQPVVKGEKWLANAWIHDSVHWEATKES